ncbi:hypothetical protein [Dechloromonas denitrificans]|nr:hypothetical protein [Dechloromonas denitrificans]UCV08462.1 hypothetical protein KI615_02720 [Dechloromonas denitrificans]
MKIALSPARKAQFHVLAVPLEFVDGLLSAQAERKALTALSPRVIFHFA